MKNRYYIYFLTVSEALEHAEKHEDDESWDLWMDGHAQIRGCVNRVVDAARMTLMGVRHGRRI